MVLNTFRRVARKQLQQEAAGKSCLESPQGYNPQEEKVWNFKMVVCPSTNQMTVYLSARAVNHDAQQHVN